MKRYNSRKMKANWWIAVSHDWEHHDKLDLALLESIQYAIGKFGEHFWRKDIGSMHNEVLLDLPDIYAN